MNPNTNDTREIPLADISNDYTVMAPMPPSPISAASPNATQVAKKQRGMPRLIQLAIYIIIAFAIAASSGIAGYAAGSNKAIATVSTTTGWRLISVTAQGSTIFIPQTADVLLAWDISQKPHNPQTDWYVVTRTTKTTVKDWTIDATRSDQGGVTIIDHTATGDRLIYGTAHGNTLQITIPPNSHLYPEATPVFLTLTFAPADVASFNQILVQGVSQ